MTSTAVFRIATNSCVQNIGLQANILSSRTFTIFVVMALLTTFTTTPLVSWLYPPWYQKKMELWRRGEIDWDTGEPTASPNDAAAQIAAPARSVSRLLVYLRLDTMPRLLRLLSLFGDANHVSDHSSTEVDRDVQQPPVLRAHGIRLLQLTDRDSSVMTVSQVDDYSLHDPLVNTFQTMGQLHHLAVSGEVAIMPEHRFAQALLTKSTAMATNLLLVPWSETGSIGDSQLISSSAQADKLVSPYMPFATEILETRDHNVAIFFTRSDKMGARDAVQDEKGKLLRQYSFGAMRRDFPVSTTAWQPYHIFMVYFGGADDEFALGLVLQLCSRSQATATVIRVETNQQSSSFRSSLIDTFFENMSEEMKTRVILERPDGVVTVEDLVQHMVSGHEIGSQHSKGSLIVVGRHAGEKLNEGKLRHHPSTETRHCFGTVASQIVKEFVQADVLVVQTGDPNEAQ